MLNNSAAIARISRELNAVEDAIDNAIGREGSLVATLAEVQSALGLPHHAGQEALMHMMAAQQALVKARGEMIRAHAGLLSVAQERMDFSTEDCPDDNSAELVEVRRIA